MSSGETMKPGLPIRTTQKGSAKNQVGKDQKKLEAIARKLRTQFEKRYEVALRHMKEMPREAKKLLSDFDQWNTAKELSPARKSDYLENLTKIRLQIGKPFSEITREDLEKYLANMSRDSYAERTIGGRKLALKVFYKWWMGNGEEYPPIVRWLKTTHKNNQLPRESILTNEEIEQLVQACDNPRDRAMVLVIAESGVRIGELLSLKIVHVRFDKYGAIITVRGKTGDRAVRLVASAPALATWLENHLDRNNPSASLWVNTGTKFHGTAITYPGAQSVIRKLVKRAGIKRRVHLHGFRHTAATRLARLLTEAELEQYLGWVQGSKMAAIYVHLSSRDVDKSLLRIHGLITEEEDKGRKFAAIECPRCKQKNSPGSTFCSSCGLALSLKAITAQDQLQELELEKKMRELGKKVARYESREFFKELAKDKDLVEKLAENEELVKALAQSISTGRAKKGEFVVE